MALDYINPQLSGEELLQISGKERVKLTFHVRLSLSNYLASRL